MVIIRSYVSLPEGSRDCILHWTPQDTMAHGINTWKTIGPRPFRQEQEAEAAEAEAQAKKTGKKKKKDRWWLTIEL